MESATVQAFLSGIEPLSNSDTSTPYHQSGIPSLDSLNSTEDPFSYPLSMPGFSPSPVKNFSNFSSPSIPTDSGSFTTAAQEITNRLKESLASSIKRENEVKASISPGRKSTKSSLSNSRSSSPAKSSPSKLKVRFDDDEPTLNDNFESELRISFSTPIGTPVKSHDLKESRTTPVKRNLLTQLSANKTPKLNQSDNFLLSSLKLPQNETERQKLFEFMKKMETSSAGDPLASLFSLETVVGNKAPNTLESFQTYHSVKNTSINDSGLNRASTKPLKTQDNVAEYHVKKKSADQKRTKQNKDANKKTTSRNNPKDFLKKGGISKKNAQKSSSSKPSNAPLKSTKDSKAKESKSSTHSRVPAFTAEGHQTINNMEAVRNRLQGMLKMDGSMAESEKVSEEYKLYFGGKDLAKNTEDGPESFRSTDTATLLSAHPSDFAPTLASPIESSAEDVDAMINSATSSIFSILKGNFKQHIPTSTTTSAKVDSSVSTENNILRDTLEKERYRRNHCEKQIQKLQNKILEIQQELAVGQSVTRKKDMMIEQLDKSLAKVVEGWKIHEQKLNKTVQQISSERDKARHEIEKLRDTLSGLQSDGMRLLEDLSTTKEKLQLKEEEQKLLQQTFQMKTHEISRVIDQKNASIEKLLNDKQTMVEDVNKLTRKMEELQEITEVEKEKWNDEVNQQQKKLEDEMKQQKNKFDLERSRNNDLQKLLTTTQQEVTRLEDLMGSLKQTIDNLKMQGSVEEAKYSAAVRKMEAEHQIELEKRVTEKLTKVHEEAEAKERELRDSHHKQVMEITRSHQSELESQCSMYEDRIEQLEQRSRQDLEDKERKFDEILREKNENLRRQMTSKMQNLLQAHYNETLEIVGNTTGNTPIRPTHAGTISNMLEDMKSSVYMAGSKLHDISNVNGSILEFQDTLRQTSNNTYSSAFESKRNQQSKFGQCNADPVSSFTRINPVNPPVASNITTSTFSNFNAPAIPSFPYTPDRGMLHPFLPVHQNENIRKMDIVDQSLMSTSDLSRVQNQQLVNSTVPNLTSNNDFKPHLSTVQSTNYEAEVNLPVTLTPLQSNAETTMSSEGDRGQYLQHYIKMLLDRSPGEPLDAPHPTTAPLQPVPPSAITTLSPIVVSGQSGNLGADENKENSDKNTTIQPNQVTSELAMGVINFLNQQLNTQPSPDLIPTVKSKSPQHQYKPQARLNQRPGAFQQVKVATKPHPINSGQNKDDKLNALSKSPKKQETKLSIQDLSVSKTNGMVNQKQLSDVSRMLGSYMSGDTQNAAQKLLNYLAESQNMDTSFTESNMKAKSKMKTPSKSLPAWR